MRIYHGYNSSRTDIKLTDVKCYFMFQKEIQSYVICVRPSVLYFKQTAQFESEARRFVVNNLVDKPVTIKYNFSRNHIDPRKAVMKITSPELDIQLKPGESKSI